MNLHSLPKKKELGAYYTPPELSQILADWAIHGPDENILEPSFGGCGFFESSIVRLKGLGCKKPEDRLFGVDIDSQAFDILSSKFGKVINTKKRFILDDFIRVNPNDFSVALFDVILGNPPYVSMHNMTLEQRKSCDDVLANSDFVQYSIGRNASLWAFFLLHSLSFLNEGGRVAWVLPSSLLHADYAVKLLAVHQKHFTQIKVIKLAERFFKAEGAEETSIVLVADGFTKEAHDAKGLIIHSVNNLAELVNCIGADEEANTAEIKDYKFNVISQEARLTYSQITSSPHAKPLGYYADVKIGMVTGANNYFVVNKNTIDEHSLPAECLKPVVGRFSSLMGVAHGKRQQNLIQKDGHRAFLVCPTEEQMSDLDSPVAKYLSQLSKEEIGGNKTFKKRPNWFAPGWGIDGVIPDAFLSYMIHRGPRIVINKGRYNCTNSIHKVIFHDKKMRANKKLALAISMLSTFSQFSAEVEGRAYSSGVLKLEPTAGKRIVLLFSDDCVQSLCELQKPIEVALKSEKYEHVAELVDNVLIKCGLISEEKLAVLRVAVEQLRCERYRGIRSF
ncbi:N-6 DNA methylase [Pseudoalteromonas luteoviolacea]|uniref:site-specific DNA-methyltransferase (adenine-specific) n=1 Tax=Pseudoalteromonas luteoviolacea DSM 6061 TaxID=1365250 RepID=A0A166XGZ9_9GAMM|nr:N-6 DNA methylase [Pseudoalteromonas luteoviolacea]KZN40306.1 hypothetical protein N475_12635 [Pseudoalteromonas luteoviolacea DSM 6061]MBE0387914.1 hypothetical protein [Pseudoalteromonas luteoviolacea DSM 6061]